MRIAPFPDARWWPIVSRSVMVAIVLALGGCSTQVETRGGRAPTNPAIASDPIGESRASATAPEEFRNWNPAQSCGDVVLPQGRFSPDASAIACMDRAFTGAGAELGTLSLTTEGDPIITFYLVGPDIDGVLVYTDGTHDSYGEKVWSRQSCPGITSLIDQCTGITAGTA